MYIGMSLDGKIARPDGDVKWLYEVPNPDKSDYGYKEFISTIGITLMGINTYRSVEEYDLENIYPGMENYVFSRDSSLKDTKDFKFYSGDPIAFIKKKLMEEGKDIWLIGGGIINALFYNENMVDEIWLFVMPVTLGAGIALFEGKLDGQRLQLMGTHSYKSGVVLLKY